MHKRYEDLVSQFIPKHNSKQLIRKNIVNSKFQWLMKYLNNDQPSTVLQPTAIFKSRKNH